MVHKPSGGSHHNLGFLFQLLGLPDDARAAVEHRHPDALVEGEQLPQLIPNLDCQLPGGSQNQPLNLRQLRLNVLDHGNAEGEGLAGAGGGLGNHILPRHQGRDGLLLNGGGVAIAPPLQRLQGRLGEPQILK